MTYVTCPTVRYHPAVRPFWEAGFTDIALVQVGDEKQERSLSTAAGPLLERLRAAAPSGG